MEGCTLWSTLELEGRYLWYISGVVSRKTKRITNTKKFNTELSRQILDAEKMKKKWHTFIWTHSNIRSRTFVSFVWILNWLSQTLKTKRIHWISAWDRSVYLASHWIRVDLTHIRARVIHLDVGDMQFPSVVSIVSHREPRVVSHHVCVDGENGLGVRLDPCHLQGRVCGSGWEAQWTIFGLQSRVAHNLFNSWQKLAFYVIDKCWLVIHLAYFKKWK